MRMKLGNRPALLIVDVTTAYLGQRGQHILQSLDRYPDSCGKAGWDSVRWIEKLRSIIKKKKLPVIYSVSPRDSFPSPYESQITKESRQNERRALHRTYTIDGIPKEIAPTRGDIVIEKSAPSPFYGASLLSRLVAMNVDTLVVAGCTTSGCVRACVVDAYSAGYRVLVVEECVFDRGEMSRRVNLFDMEQKYANVISLAEAKKYIMSVNEKAN